MSQGITCITLSKTRSLEGTARAVYPKWNEPRWLSIPQRARMADTLGNSIGNDTTNYIVPLRVRVIPSATIYPLGCNEVQLVIARVVDPKWTSDMHFLIGVVGGPRIWSYYGADVIIGMGLDAVFAFAATLVAVFDCLVGLGGAVLGEVVALGVTLLCQHDMSCCIVQTSSSFSFPSGVDPMWSQVFPASVSPMSVNSYLSGQCQLMSETQYQRLNVRDSMSETQCQRLTVRDSILATQCQRLNVTVEFANQVTYLCYTIQLGVLCDIHVQRDIGFVLLNFPSLNCCEQFSDCRWVTHSIYVPGRLLQQRGIDSFGPVWNAGRPSQGKSWWCHNTGCTVDMRVTQ